MIRPFSPRSPSGARRAFTLTELLMAAAVAMLVLAVLTTFTIFTLRMNKRVEIRSEVDSSIRPLMARIESDIGNALSVTSLGASEIVLSLPQLVGGSYVKGSVRAVSYRLDAGAKALVRTDSLAGASTRELSNVTALTFACRDKSGNVTTAPADVASVAVSLSCTLPQGTGPALVVRENGALVRLRSVRP